MSIHAELHQTVRLFLPLPPHVQRMHLFRQRRHADSLKIKSSVCLITPLRICVGHEKGIADWNHTTVQFGSDSIMRSR